MQRGTGRAGGWHRLRRLPLAQERLEARQRIRFAVIPWELLKSDIAAPAKGDQLGCTVLLCTSPGAPPWQSIPECVQPVTTAYWMAQPGVSHPSISRC